MFAIITCVHYDDFLRITLPFTSKVFKRGIVVTSHACCGSVRAITAEYPGWLPVPTNAFYRDGAPFNKGAALDAALREFCDERWICVLDADIIIPETIDTSNLNEEFLYSPHRRLMREPGDIPPEPEWSELGYGPEIRNGEYAGYCHLFHADHMPPPPWYDSPLWDTAQGCDTVFWRKYGIRRCRRPDFEVLHLGPTRVNWSGRVTPRWE